MRKRKERVDNKSPQPRALRAAGGVGRGRGGVLRLLALFERDAKVTEKGFRLLLRARGGN
jgi:hypothetical protein